MSKYDYSKIYSKYLINCNNWNIKLKNIKLIIIKLHIIYFIPTNPSIYYY